MGLAGRKQKQRIPADPRNLSWADDASRFGLSYLSKLGWDASQGLGSSGDGMKTHIKVQQKLDMMGIGVQHQRDPNGIAWKQNKEFESLLKRLNEGAGQGDRVDEQGTPLGTAFVRAQEGQLASQLSAVTKKRKHRDDTDAVEDMEKKKHKKKHQKFSSDEAAAPTLDSTSESPPPRAPSVSVAKSRPMAHRARIRAAKRIAGKSASAISEILGIAPSSSMSSSPSTPAPTMPSTSDTRPSLTLNKLTTSTKSVADYFKEKLLARSSSSSSPISSGSATPGLGTTGLGSDLSNTPPNDEADPPRRGIGSRAPAILPLLQEPEGLTSDDSNSNTDGRDMLTEKQRLKLERKKRKRRKIGDDQVSLKDVSTSLKEQTKEDDAKTARKTSKEKKRREQEQRMPTGGLSGDDGAIAEIEREGDAPCNSLQKAHKKSKREHKKKYSGH